MKIREILKSTKNWDKRQFTALMAESDRNILCLKKNCLDFTGTVYFNNPANQNRAAKVARKKMEVASEKAGDDLADNTDLAEYVPLPTEEEKFTNLAEPYETKTYVYMSGIVFFLTSEQYKNIKNVIFRQRIIADKIAELAQKLKMI